MVYFIAALGLFVIYLAFLFYCVVWFFVGLRFVLIDACYSWFCYGSLIWYVFVRLCFVVWVVFYMFYYSVIDTKLIVVYLDDFVFGFTINFWFV